jgi:hypothetical protein
MQICRGWRRDLTTQEERVGEIAAHGAGWSVLFEIIGPHIMWTARDPWDVVACAGGALVAAGWWQWQAGSPANCDFLPAPYRWME